MSENEYLPNESSYRNEKDPNQNTEISVHEQQKDHFSFINQNELLLVYYRPAEAFVINKYMPAPFKLESEENYQKYIRRKIHYPLLSQRRKRKRKKNLEKFSSSSINDGNYGKRKIKKKQPSETTSELIYIQEICKKIIEKIKLCKNEKYFHSVHSIQTLLEVNNFTKKRNKIPVESLTSLKPVYKKVFEKKYKTIYHLQIDINLVFDYLYREYSRFPQIFRLLTDFSNSCENIISEFERTYKENLRDFRKGKITLDSENKLTENNESKQYQVPSNERKESLHSYNKAKEPKTPRNYLPSENNRMNSNVNKLTSLNSTSKPSFNNKYNQAFQKNKDVKQRKVPSYNNQKRKEIFKTISSGNLALHARDSGDIAMNQGLTEEQKTELVSNVNLLDETQLRQVVKIANAPIRDDSYVFDVGSLEPSKQRELYEYVTSCIKDKPRYPEEVKSIWVKESNEKIMERINELKVQIYFYFLDWTVRSSYSDFIRRR